MKLFENAIEMTIPSPPHFKKRGRLLSQTPYDRRPCPQMVIVRHHFISYSTLQL